MPLATLSAMPPIFAEPPQPRQRVLDLGHDAAAGRADFLVSAANEAALAWIDRWPDWPGLALAIEGPSGSGKSHLAGIWSAKSGAEKLAADLLTARSVPYYVAAAFSLALEDSQARCGDEDFEEALFHLYNAMRATGRSLLLTGTLPPARWPVRLPDLASRLATVPVTRIDPPDDALLEALFYKLFADRQLRLAPEIVSYILPRMERSFGAAHAIVADMDRIALERKAPVTLATARAVFNDLRD